MLRRTLIASFLFLIACSPNEPATAQQAPRSSPPPTGAAQEAVFAGGCFWCMEHDMGAIPGVLDVMSGYTGGRNANATYENHPGHYEAVRVRFDSSRISYRQLVDRYWRLTDPTDERAWGKRSRALAEMPVPAPAGASVTPVKPEPPVRPPR